MGAQCARKRHRLETEHEKLAAVVGGANTRVNWGLDNPKFSWRGTDARFFVSPLVRLGVVQFHETFTASLLQSFLCVLFVFVASAIFMLVH